MSSENVFFACKNWMLDWVSHDAKPHDFLCDTLNISSDSLFVLQTSLCFMLILQYALYYEYITCIILWVYNMHYIMSI